MPVIIREMIIRADVREKKSSGEKNSSESIKKEEVVAEAVDRVLEILKRQKER